METRLENARGGVSRDQKWVWSRLENARGGVSRDQKWVWSMFVRVIVGLRIRV